MTHNDIDQELDIDQQLQQLYRSHARSVDNQAFTDALGGRLAKVRGRSIVGLSPRRASLLAAGLVVVIAGLVVGSIEAIQHLGGPSPVLVLGEPTQPAEGEDQIERFPVPGYLPAGAELVYGDYAVPDPANPDSVDAVIARATADGFTDSVVVTAYDSSQVAIEIPEGEPVDLSGQSATLVRSKGGVTLWWQQSSRVVSVRAPSGDSSLAETIAATVEVSDAGPFGPAVVSFGTLPDGFSVFAAPRLASRQAHPYVSIQSPIGPETAEPEVATIAVLDDPLHQVAGAFGAATTVEIAGVDGFLVEQDTRTAFIWSLSPTVTITVGGTYQPGDIRAIAEDLEFVTETDWRRQYDNTGPQLPTTTTTTTTQSDQAEGAVPIATQQARDIGDAIVERFPQFEVGSATETSEGEFHLLEIELMDATQAGAGRVSIDYFGPDQPIPTADSTTTSIAPERGPNNEELVVTHPEITGSVASYLVQWPQGVRWQLIAQFPDQKEINVVAAAADTSGGEPAPLDGNRLIELVEVLVKILY